MTDHLKMIGYTVNIMEERLEVYPDTIGSRTNKMGLETIYPKKCLSKGGKARHIHPYLLRNLSITHRNQVWSTDISYVPLEHGFMYLYAMIDVYSRYVLGWRLSNTLSARNCYELLQECIEQHGAPEIVNTDQGSQCTTEEWEQMLTDNHIRISMDGRGRCEDSIWIERFWRTIKQEHIYLHPTDDVPALRHGIGDWIKFYNEQRPHQSL